MVFLVSDAIVKTHGTCKLYYMSKTLQKAYYILGITDYIVTMSIINRILSKKGRKNGFFEVLSISASV